MSRHGFNKILNNDLGKVKQKYKFSETWGKLISYCKSHLAITIIALLCAVGGAIFTILGPDKLSEMTDVITSGMMMGIDLDLVTSIALTLVAYYSTSVILSYAQNYIMATVTQRVSKKLRRDISQKINRLPLKYFDTNSTGDVISRVTNDVDTIGQTLNQSIGSLVSAIALFIGSIVMMFVTNWIMALVAIGSSFIGFIFVSIIAVNSQKHFVSQQKFLGQINGHIEEVYSGHNVVKAYNAEEKLNKEFDAINKNLANSTFKAQFMSGLMMPIMGFIGNFGYLAVCVVGALLVIDGTISFGVIVAFMIYVRLFTQALNQIAQAAATLQSTAAASYRVFEFLNEKELINENDKKEVLKDIKGNIEFKNVRFGYDENKIIIHDLSSKIKRGQKIAIVGPTGAGKTTIVNLLMRFYELNQPRLILNKTITDYKIFDNGKSVVIKIDKENNVYINNERTEFVLDENIAKSLPKNKNMKFDQDFNLNVNKKNIDYKADIITGDKIDNELEIDFGVAYYGDILVDEMPTKALTRENVHDLFCMVLQDTWLFEGTIQDNIIYNKNGISEEDVRKACEAVGVDHFIKTLPDGYNTILNEEASLSAGQRQLITIARAMVNNAPMLILDEATSSVDTRTEILIQKAMDKLTTNKTSIIIAHRLSTIKNADLILVMKDGDIVEKGNHKQLLKANGFYSELYNSQFEKVS